jgi:3-oxoadipate enol-lactonase
MKVTGDPDIPESELPMKSLIHANDEDFDVLLEGPAGAPVVMLSNSLGTTFEMWSGQARALQERFRVLRYNPRGFSATSRASGDFSIAQMGHDAIALMDALELRKVHWCGTRWAVRSACGCC